MITANKKQLILLIAQERYKKMRETYMKEYLGKRAEQQEVGVENAEQIYGQDRGHMANNIEEAGSQLQIADSGQLGDQHP
jgi:hypothetical protein